MSLYTPFRRTALLAAMLLVPAGAFAQAEAEQESPAPATLTVSPEELTLTAGETARLGATVLDGDGNEVEVEVLYLPLYGQYWNLEERTWGFNLFTVSPDGRVSTVRPASTPCWCGWWAGRAMRRRGTRTPPAICSSACRSPSSRGRRRRSC